MNARKFLGFVIGLPLIIGVAALLYHFVQKEEAPESVNEEPVEVAELPPAVPASTQASIGSSIEGRKIEAFSFGTGATDVLFVGGIHGGYEWNSSLLAYEVIDYFKQNGESVIPDNITVHIIPILNPDGLFLSTGIEGRFSALDVTDKTSMHAAGKGRMNGNNVDLNRNFDCNWNPTSSWRSNPVSGGSAVFSEPEAIALRDYIANLDLSAAVFWHSMAGNVYGSSCDGTLALSTSALVDAYAGASNYGAVPLFTAYPVTGAAEDWLAKLNIPAVTVELNSRTSSELEQNLAGTLATLRLYME